MGGEESKKREEAAKQSKKSYLYVGETCRSAYERGLEHLNDIKQLKPSSHMLKHLIDKHEHENFDDIEFRMEILSFSRTAYERQIMEAVQIQLHREDHHLLNSRAEFNRSAIPRLGLKLGDNEYKERKEEESDEEKKEETILMKIRELKKERNRERGNQRRAEFRNRDKEPARKRRKVDSLGEQSVPGEDVGKTMSESEKRKLHQGGGPTKKQKTLDSYILQTGTELRSGESRQEMSRQEQPQCNQPKIDDKLEETVITKPQPDNKEETTAEYPSGKLNLERDLVIDWESKFEEHRGYWRRRPE